MFGVTIMQNNSNKNLYSLTHDVRQKYQQLFSPTFNHLRLKQMPEFQLRLFLNQAYNNQLTVRLDFNSGGVSVIGMVSVIGNDRYLVATKNQRFTRIAKLTDIKSIQRV